MSITKETIQSETLAEIRLALATALVETLNPQFNSPTFQSSLAKARALLQRGIDIPIVPIDRLWLCRICRNVQPLDIAMTGVCCAPGGNPPNGCECPSPPDVF